MALALIGVGLVGCGRFGFERRAEWRLQAEEACLASKLVTPTAYMSRIGEIDGPGACGMVYPFRATALGHGTVGLTNRLTLACPIIPQIDSWLDEIVQPAAELYFGSAVTDVKAGSYSCRGRNNQPGAKVSEHAFGNAIDIMSFKLADGRTISVERGWRGDPQEQDFLRETFVGACRYFTTVLGPGSDIFHYNHFHLDLARHNVRGDRHICKPIIKFEPRIDPDKPPERRIRPLPSPRQEEPGAPLDVDEEGDPYAVSGGPAQPRQTPARAMASQSAPPRAEPARREAPASPGLSASRPVASLPPPPQSYPQLGAPPRPLGQSYGVMPPPPPQSGLSSGAAIY